MRFKGFKRRIVGQSGAEFVPFGPEHFKQAGVPHSPYVGMPVLEAFQLVNHLNIQQTGAVHFLEA